MSEELQTGPEVVDTDASGSTISAGDPSIVQKVVPNKAKAPRKPKRAKAPAAAEPTGDAAGAAIDAPPADADLVSFELPVAQGAVHGYMPTHVDVSLDGRQAEVLRRIGDGMRAGGAHIHQPADTFRRILDAIGKQLSAP